MWIIYLNYLFNNDSEWWEMGDKFRNESIFDWEDAFRIIAE